MFLIRAVASCASLFAFLSGSVAFAEPVRPVRGAVIVAQTSPGDARLIWDATDYVTQLVAEKIAGDRGVRAIEATALRALAEKGKTLSATMLTLSVTYAKTGAVSPVYRSATFAGFEPLVTIAAKRAALAEHAAAWSAQLANGTIPRGVTVSVTGKLPPA
jgi:hypothetical protein